MHTRVGQVINLPWRFDDFVLSLIEVITKPSTYAEATQVPSWCDAMEYKIHAIHKNQTW
jgi:hypothetical protein